MASIFKKANGERLFRTDTDVREIEQQRVCSANSTLNSVHGSTLFNSATDGSGSKQNRVRTANSQLKNEHGRSFFSVPAVNLCSRLVSILSICKKANGKRLFRTDKDVGGSIQKRVCLQTRSPRMYTDVHSWARHLRRCCAKINAQRTKSTSPLYFCSRLVVSERTRMSVVLLSSDVFAAQKLVVRTPKDGRDINQKRVLYKTRLFPTYTEVCREKVYTDVHFRTGYFQKS